MGLFGILQICTLWAQEPPSGATEQNTPEPALTLRPATPADKPVHHPEKPELSELILVGGTPIRVAISDRVRISQEGAPIHGPGQVLAGEARSPAVSQGLMQYREYIE